MMEKPLTETKKYDIVNYIAKKYNYKHYLELCTPKTGNFYHAIDRSIFDTCHRLMYRCPTNFNGSLPVDYRCGDENIILVLAQLRADRTQIDICLVDGYHTYHNTRRDLAEAFNLISDGGILVVHDCLPPTIEFASPTFRYGNRGWCGVTYKAFLDFVLFNNHIDYCTVDTDFGCGIIVKNRRLSLRKRTFSSDILERFIQRWLKNGVFQRWLTIADDYDLAYNYLIENKHTLLRLISSEQFWN